MLSDTVVVFPIPTSLFIIWPTSNPGLSRVVLAPPFVTVLGSVSTPGTERWLHSLSTGRWAGAGPHLWPHRKHGPHHKEEVLEAV